MSATAATRGTAGGGFTLVELICALVIVGALGSVSSGLIYSGLRSYRDASTRALLHTDASMAMERAFRVLTGIPRDTSSTVIAPAISEVTAGSIAWSGGNALRLDGMRLMLTENGGTPRPILDRVTAFALEAFDESNAAMAASLSGAATRPVRRLRLTVTVTADGVSETIRMRVFIRCTMSGAAIG